MIWAFTLAVCIWVFFQRRNTYNIYINPEPEYFYKSDEEFDREQIIKHHPELLYQLLNKEYEAGLIHKADYDKAIENLIKDISI